MYDLSQGFYSANMKAALFLRAERLSDGQRTYRLAEGKPLPTSHGEDLYGQIFGGSERVATEVDLHLLRPPPLVEFTNS
jgi:hypothetical protein